MDIQDMHEFIKHLNYTIVLLDLVRDKANSPVHSTTATNKRNRSINKNRKTNKNNIKVRPNKHIEDTTKMSQVKPNAKTYPLHEMKEDNKKSMEPKK